MTNTQFNEDRIINATSTETIENWMIKLNEEITKLIELSSSNLKEY